MHLLFKFSLTFLLFFSHLLHSNEFEEFHLYPEYIYGKNRGPKLGYTEPPIYDPLNDPLFRSGYKDFTPVGVANSVLTPLEKTGIPFNNLRVAGAGTGSRPWAQSTKPSPIFKGEE